MRLVSSWLAGEVVGEVGFLHLRARAWEEAVEVEEELQLQYRAMVEAAVVQMFEVKEAEPVHLMRGAAAEVYPVEEGRVHFEAQKA